MTYHQLTVDLMELNLGNPLTPRRFQTLAEYELDRDSIFDVVMAMHDGVDFVDAVDEALAIRDSWFK